MTTNNPLPLDLRLRNLNALDPAICDYSVELFNKMYSVTITEADLDRPLSLLLFGRSISLHLVKAS